MTDYAGDCQNQFPSLWSATATENDPSTPLDGDTRCDVAVVGAGYTGLSAAIELQRRGVSVCVLDGGFPGWGGSGRNSGAVIRGFKNSRSELVKEFGEQRGRAMADFGAKVSARVFSLIDEFSIRCDLKRTGWILPAHNKGGLARIEERVRLWTEDGFPGLSMIAREDLARQLGSQHYIGGMIDSEGASLNPLSYARGLARAAMEFGARVHRETPVTHIRQASAGWRLETPRGAVHAKQVLVATDAYSSGLEASLDRSTATVHTNIVSTYPLPKDIADSILPGEQAVSDIRRILYYWHKDPHGRILFGTRGSLRGPNSEREFNHVQAAMLSVYPQLAGQPIEFRWSGKVGLTGNFVPHINQPKPGLWTSHGYCGRGVAMATAYGTLVGQVIAADPGIGELPVPHGPAPSMPPEPLRGMGVMAVTNFYRLLDLVN
ncbi:FAD-dependent oxidoreductase [Falsochrobactrum shanghaiense]|uniref:FAD-dependent oxidoreductase n=1 Tax=Falsochrobactrum shanghaiense TaxID=2201899 RepID=A0A316J8Q2_9HYPH|nr:FAD-binding oxidoreductase [Falsochrobactrum shanghaiense]PWL18342.1 FAD-dependent oxidoreductase [Falsochrobactrum shanghaiense]